MPDYPTPGEQVDLVWPISRMKDRAGNTIDYKYTSNVKLPYFSYAILSISYPEGRTVTFDYDDRTLPTLAWTKGIARVTDRKLRRISLTTPDHPDFSFYSLDFTLSSATSRPLLTGVQHCASGTCTQAKQFAYDQTKLSFSEVDYGGIH